MAEILKDSGLTGDRARLLDSRDSQTPAVDDKPKDDMAPLTEWVVTRARQWREHRKQNYETQWDQYERLWRGLWEPADKNKKSERSTLVTPGLSEAVENIVAEVEEAVFGRGDFFDIKAELADEEMLKQITEKNKAHLKEDLSNSDFSPNVGEALINAAVYGTGIGEIIVETFIKREIVASLEAMQAGVAPEMQIIEKETSFAVMQSVNPRNFFIDPTAKTIDKALGCGVEEYVGAHLIAAGQKSGAYRKVEVGTSAGDSEIGVDRQVENEYTQDKVHVIRYYGLVPKHLLFPNGEYEEIVEEAPNDALKDAEVVEEILPKEDQAVSGEKSIEPVDAEMIEAVVIIANQGVCIKAVKNPYLMQDRQVVAFPWDVVPGRFWGRGVCEKGIVPQKVMDAEMRARIDALAYITAPMMAMDASRLPRGFQFSVKPGKSILTNGNPKDILNPMHFGQLDQSTFTHTQQLDQMIQRATGSLDVISLAQRGGDARPGAVSMMLSGIVKRHKRTLMSFVDRFFVPALRKLMWRNMQFNPERYTPLNWSFVASSTMGIIQREYETQNLIQLMNTMEPQSKEYKVLLMGVVGNTGLTHRHQLVKMLQTSIQAAEMAEQQQIQAAQDPVMQDAQTQLQQANIQLTIAETQAKIAELQARTRLQDAKARNEALEPQFRQMEIATKGIYEVAENRQQNEFDRRMAVADRVLQAKDIESNERIARIQTRGNVTAERTKSAASVASERVKASAQPKEPVPIPVPVPVPARRVVAPSPFGPMPLVGRQARIVR